VHYINFWLTAKQQINNNDIIAAVQVHTDRNWK